MRGFKPSEHWFHIPVMGTGFTIDAPYKVAPFGISSSISLVDDVLIEKMRKYYCQKTGRPFEHISNKNPDSRAQRITAYLDLMEDLVNDRIQMIKNLPFEAGNEKDKYFNMLPPDSPSRDAYLHYMESGKTQPETEASLNDRIIPGDIDVNIMTKVDRQQYDALGESRGPLFTDAKCALRGFGLSKVKSNVVFSAGMNPTLYGYLENFSSFYWRDNTPPDKGVILKISDFRSALIQSKFLAKKGILVHEWRWESGINCGGHAFVADGKLMGPILQEFLDNREQIMSAIHAELKRYYAQKEEDVPKGMLDFRCRLTVQGGLGNGGENQRMRETYGVDSVGWASPFLLVPEVTALDEITRGQLKDATEQEIYRSDASPLGIPFYNLRNSSSETWHLQQIQEGLPGSACPKGFLVSNKEFRDIPICTASTEYQTEKLREIGREPELEKKVLVKQCICHHLGHGALLQYGIMKSPATPVSVCPGPNLAYFDREYTLEEMVSIIYAESPPMTKAHRPHVFAKEMMLYTEYFETLIEETNEPSAGELTAGTFKRLRTIMDNLEDGAGHYRRLIKHQDPYPFESFSSLEKGVAESLVRARHSWQSLEARMNAAKSASG